MMINPRVFIIQTGELLSLTFYLHPMVDMAVVDRALIDYHPIHSSLAVPGSGGEHVVGYKRTCPSVGWLHPSLAQPIIATFYQEAIYLRVSGLPPQHV